MRNCLVYKDHGKHINTADWRLGYPVAVQISRKCLGFGCLGPRRFSRRAAEVFAFVIFDDCAGPTSCHRTSRIVIIRGQRRSVLYISTRSGQSSYCKQHASRLTASRTERRPFVTAGDDVSILVGR